MDNSNYDELLTKVASVFQIGSFLMNVTQLQNEDLMKALEYQNSNYLETIVGNQKQILEKMEMLLEKIKSLEDKK